MQNSVDRAFAPLAEAVERHEPAIVGNDEHNKALDMRTETQTTAMEQLRSVLLVLRSAQNVAEGI